MRNDKVQGILFDKSTVIDLTPQPAHVRVARKLKQSQTTIQKRLKISRHKYQIKNPNGQSHIDSYMSNKQRQIVLRDISSRLKNRG